MCLCVCVCVWGGGGGGVKEKEYQHTHVGSLHVLSPHAAVSISRLSWDSIWGWLRPFCSYSQFGSLKELKPMFGQ